MSSSESAFNKSWWGDISKLTDANYDEWKDDMIFILSAMRAYAFITGDDPEQQPLDFVHDDNYDDWKAKEAEAVSMIRLSCSPEVRCIVKGMRNPLKMVEYATNQPRHHRILYRQTGHPSPVPCLPT
jgi:hypothetical protein